MHTYGINKWMYLHKLFHDHCGRSAPSEPLKSSSPCRVGDAASCLGHPPGHYCYVNKGREGQQRDHWTRSQEAYFCWLSCPHTVSLGKSSLPPLASTMPSSLIYMNWTEWSQTSFPCSEDFKTPSEEDHQLLVLRGSFLKRVCVTYKQQGPALEDPSISNKCKTLRKCRFCRLSIKNSTDISKAWLQAWSYSYSKKLSGAGRLDNVIGQK